MSVSSLETFLHPDFVSDVEAVFTDMEFPWFWRSSTTYGEGEAGKDHKDFQFIHLIYYENEAKSNIFGMAQHILFEFEAKTGMRIKDVHKVKANLTTQSWLTEEDLAPAKHIDIEKGSGKYLTIVYYVLDSDGDTIVYSDEGQEIARKAPVKGTAVYFPSHMWHRHTPPRDHKRRIVINFVLELV